MSNFDNQDQSSEYEKWAKWTMNPPRSSDIKVKCLSVFLFVLTAGTHMAGIVA